VRELVRMLSFAKAIRAVYRGFRREKMIHICLMQEKLMLLPLTA